MILVGESLNMNSDPKAHLKLQDYISCSGLEKINKVLTEHMTTQQWRKDPGQVSKPGHGAA